MNVATSNLLPAVRRFAPALAGAIALLAAPALAQSKPDQVFRLNPRTNKAPR